MSKIKPVKVIVIVGPTASGKSDLAIKIAQKFNGEIISADSRQVYRRMDIGTGKVRRDRTFPVPNSKLKNQNTKFRNYFYSSDIRHHLINIANPKKQFTANDFKKLGRKAVANIISRGKVPVIVGGTGFYIDILLGRLSVAEVPPNKKLRVKLEKQSTEQLFKQLQKLDPQRAKTIEPKNKRRLIRVLEITDSLGQVPAYSLRPKTYNTLWIGLRPKNLEQKIKKRLDARLKQGMVKEVANLRKQGLSWKRLGDFGLEYRWISQYLRNDISKSKNFKESEYYEKLLREIIRYSKRQMTWFKRNPEIKWLASSKVERVKEAERLVKLFL